MYFKLWEDAAAGRGLTILHDDDADINRLSGRVDEQQRLCRASVRDQQGRGRTLRGSNKANLLLTD